MNVSDLFGWLDYVLIGMAVLMLIVAGASLALAIYFAAKKSKEE